MRLTVLGGCGGWPAAGLACSGYLVEHDGFRLLIDPGYAIVPRLLAVVDAAAVDAVLVSHGHPDHCADLNPLLRGWARYFGFSQLHELEALDGWTRRRLRCVVWVQWRTRGRRYRELKRLKVNRELSGFREPMRSHSHIIH